MPFSAAGLAVCDVDSSRGERSDNLACPHPEAGRDVWGGPIVQWPVVYAVCDKVQRGYLSRVFGSPCEVPDSEQENDSDSG